jgi:hypothetical protein
MRLENAAYYVALSPNGERMGYPRRAVILRKPLA